MLRDIITAAAFTAAVVVMLTVIDVIPSADYISKYGLKAVVLRIWEGNDQNKDK